MKVMINQGVRQGCNLSVRIKIITQDAVIEQVAHFKYLYCDITYELDKDINKLHDFQLVVPCLKNIYQIKYQNNINQMEEELLVK